MTSLRVVPRSPWGRLRSHPAPAMWGLLVAVAVVALAVVALRNEAGHHRDEVRAELIREGSRIRAGLEHAVDLRVARTEALVGYATADLADGEVDVDGFEAFVGQVQAATDVPLRSLQLAPAGVVTHVHPLEGNEAAIGHDLMEDPARREAVEATIRARRTMVAGPFELLQGGEAVVARAPVFLPAMGDTPEEWWGLATIVADVDPIYADAGLDGLDGDVEVALRGRDATGADGGTFLGDEVVFDGDPVTFEVTLPNGSWELGLLPAGGWGSVVLPDRAGGLVLGLVLALLLGGAVWRVLDSRTLARSVLAERAELIDTVTAPIVQLDRDGQVVVWNPSAAAVSGIDGADAVGRTLDEIDADTGFCPALQSLLDEVVGGPSGVLDREIEVRRADGDTTTLVCNVEPVRDRGGATSGVIVVAQDVTARAEAERVRRENTAIAESARLKDEFLASTSHELRTPLNGIIGLTSLLRHGTAGELTPKQAEYVDHVHASGQHLLSLINDVLDLAKLGSGDDEVAVGAVDPRAAFTDAVDLVRPLAAERDIDLVVALDASLPPVVAEERRLVQVGVNLLSNAVKFTEPGGRVEVTAVVSDDEVRVAVTDTGIGIADDTLGLLFRPFTQVDARLDRAHGGTGLGLALSQGFVQRFGGRIDVESERGVGSTFTVVLARALEPVVDVVVDDDGPAVESRPAPRPGRLLVAEDNAVNRVILEGFLTARGYELVEVENGQEAVEAARRERPDAILMDIQMPAMDGLEATRVLRSDRATWDIPIVALTALAMDGDEERCLAAGCDAFVSKPVDLDELAAVLTGLLPASVVAQPAG